MHAKILDPYQLRLINAYWRAANYLSIYLPSPNKFVEHRDPRTGYAGDSRRALAVRTQAMRRQAHA